jgi:hypothetical protein
MKCAIEMGSGGMTYVLSFIKIGSGIQMLIGGGGGYTNIHTDRKVISCAYNYFFKIRNVRFTGRLMNELQSTPDT